ncbi:MAG TPA: prolyl oligopeptidase family serine peptidase [Candidatus Binatia bacterium]|nr:prolyl oligopeptidase family serine peptidase [Candidatus Binatia bacterium]
MTDRARFKQQIVAEFLSPARPWKKQKVIILCDGMPGMPRKQALLEFLEAKGYWVFYPRYRGSWESDGTFLQKSPERDILDVIDELPKGVRELAFGKRFALNPDEIFVIGGSFGGAAAILASLDKRVKKVIANCPVVDWKILAAEERLETSNPNYAAYIREAFGNGYRLSDSNWRKLHGGKFYNPAYHVKEINPAKIMMFHAKDDPYVPYKSVKNFADRTGVKLNSFARGGHVSTEMIVQKYWNRIKRFFEAGD